MTTDMAKPGDAVELAEKMIEAHADGRVVTYCGAEIGTDGSLKQHVDAYEITDTEYRGEYVTIGESGPHGHTNSVVLDDDSFAFIESEGDDA